MPLPRSLTFDQLRPSLLAAGLPVDEAMASVAALATPDDLATLAELIGEPIPLEYVIEFSGHTFVEPQTGAIVDVSSVVDRVSARPAGEATAELVNILGNYSDDPAIAATIDALDDFSTRPLPVFEYRYAQVPDSVEEIASWVSDQRDRMDLAERIIPLVLGLTGSICIGAGVLLLLRNRVAGRRCSHDHDDDEVPTRLAPDALARPRRHNRRCLQGNSARPRRPAGAALAREAEWRSLSWAEYEQSVTAVATALRDWGLVSGDRVGILAANRPAWHIVDIATMSAGLVSVPVYPTNAASQVRYVLAHSGARVASSRTSTSWPRCCSAERNCPRWNTSL